MSRQSFMVQNMKVHDARIPFSGRNLTFRDVVGGARPHLLILNKADLIPESDQEAIRRESMRQSPHISRVLFTNCKTFYCPQTAAIIPTASKLVGGEDRSAPKMIFWMRDNFLGGIDQSVQTALCLWLAFPMLGRAVSSTN